LEIYITEKTSVSSMIFISMMSIYI